MANTTVNKVVLGNETLLDLTADTATAADVAQGKTFHLASGVAAVGTASVGGSGGGLELLLTYPMGALSTTSTTAVSTGITLTVPNAGQYPLMLVDVRIDTVASKKHVATVSYVTLAGSSGGPAGATINSVARNGEFTYRKGTRTAIDFNSMSLYGIYVNSATYSSGSVHMNMYMRYDAAYSGTINGTYTARVYGVDLFSLGS